MPALLTVLAAIIAGAVSLVALTLGKEQKVSEFRQAWIDALRLDLATFLSSSRAFARAMQARSLHGAETRDPAKALFTFEKAGEIRLAAAEAFYRVKLRINPDEASHQELLRLMKQAIHDQNSDLQSEGTSGLDVLASIDRVADAASPILKAEWERVKAGECQYRFTRIAAIVVLVAALLSFVVLWFR